MQLEGMAHHHQIEVRAGKTRQWAQMMVFKLYKHGTDVTLKCIVKKKGKECGDEEPVVSEDQANMDLNDGGNVSLEAARTMVYVLSLPLGTTMVGSSYYMSLGY